MENWFLHHIFCKASWDLQLPGAPPVVESTLQLSGPGTYSCRKHPQLSGVSKEPTVVWTTYSCREHLQLSRVPSVIQSAPSCREHLHSWGGGTPILGHTRDVRPEWVSFPGQKPVDGCKFLTKNLRMGHNFDITLPGNGWFSSKLNKTYCSLVNLVWEWVCFCLLMGKL